MSQNIPGFEAPTTNQQSPAAGEPEVQIPEGAVLSPDRPPRSPENPPAEPKARKPRGFAAMDRKLVSEIARKGGKAAHTAGTAHEFSSDEAREAGRKGGRATHEKRRQRVEPSPAAPEASPSEEPKKE